MDSLGNIFIIWQEIDVGSNKTSIWSNRLENSWVEPLNSLNWQVSRAEVISGNLSVGNVSNPKIAIDDRGNVLAVWRQDEFVNSVTVSKIVSNRLTSDWLVKPDVETVWSETNISIIGENVHSATNPKITMDDKGRALLLWNQYGDNGTTAFNIVSRFE